MTLVKNNEIRELKLKEKAEDVSKMPAYDMKLEAMIPVLKKEVPLKAHAHRADDILTSIRIAKEFDIDITIEHATEAHLAPDRISKEGFPLLTTKKLHLKSIIYELLWFLNGDTNAKWLQERGVRIWNEWADEDGNLGHIYGYQWRSWPDYNGGHIDQITRVINDIKNNPDSRRMIVSAWNVADLGNMNLPPCHILFQFYVADGKLSLQLYQRSADIFLGVPFNIASYALLLKIVAQVTGLKAGDFVHTLGDAHIYTNHLEQVKLQLTRDTRTLPTMQINPNVTDLFSFDYDDFQLINYNPHPHIAGVVSV